MPGIATEDTSTHSEPPPPVYRPLRPADKVLSQVVAQQLEIDLFLAKLLKVVARSSPKGKRDYAILLLACRLGVRLGDIRALRLESLNWEAATVDIIQSETGAPLQLPLTEEVGEALIDYLRAGRPPADRTPRGVPQTEPTFRAVQRKQSSPPDRHALEETGRDRVS